MYCYFSDYRRSLFDKIKIGKNIPVRCETVKNDG